jgi:hypothetical protein
VVTEQDPWEAARARTREQVRETFAQHRPTAATRTCAFCGEQTTTHFEHCPQCGRSYFERPPRLNRAARRGLLALAVLAVGAIAGWAVPQLVSFRHSSDSRARAGEARIIAAERTRVIAEQRPHRGQARALKPPPGAAPEARLRARRGLVTAAESSITADARARVAAGLLSGAAPTHTQCGPLVRDQVAGDEEDLTKPIGRYSCVAVVSDAEQAGKHVGVFGIPFVAALDFRRFTYVWCKDNPASNPGSTGPVFVRLARACLATRGRAFGTGYLER